MSEQYVDGQVVNGHRYVQATNSWEPVTVTPPPPSVGDADPLGPPPGKKSRKGMWIAIAGGVLVLLAIGAVASSGNSGSPAASQPTPPATSSSPDAPTPSDTPTPVSTEPVETPLVAKDIALKVKVTDKACFGSAGCNVTYQVRLAWADQHPLDGAYDVTVTVTGDESGPQIQTLTVQPDGTYSYSDEIASTPSSKTVLKAKITEISPAGT